MTVTTPDCAPCRTAENLRTVRSSSASAAWVSQSHEVEHVTVDFGDLFQVSKVVLKPYYSKRYAIEYMDGGGVWKDYMAWDDAAEGDDVKLVELQKVVMAQKMKLMVDQGRRSSWKVFNVHGRPARQPTGPAGWPPHTGPVVLDVLEHEAMLAVGETVILLHPPLPLVGVSTGINRGCHQNDSLVNG